MSTRITQPWHRLPDETPKAFAAFMVYLELGQKRSLRKVGEASGKSQGYDRVLARWSSHYGWVERAAAYDDWRLDEQLERRERVLERARQAIVDRVPDAVDELIRLATDPTADMARLPAIREVLDRAGLARIQRLEHTGKGGKPIATETVTPDGPDPLDELTRRLASLAARG